MKKSIIPFLDAGGFQVGAHPQAHPQSQARHAAALRFEATENPNQISGQTMEEVKHEDNVSHLYQS